MKPCQIVLADDHALIRRGLKKIIDGQPSLQVVGDVGDGLELLKLLEEKCPDLILLDISMPNLRGLEAIPQVRKLCPQAKILMLTMHSSKDFLVSAIRAGADGYALKEDSDTELLSAIQKCMNGLRYIAPSLAASISPQDLEIMSSPLRITHEELTVREKQVLTMVAEGHKSKDVAKLLSISIRTVEHHRANIMKKIDIKSTADLIKYAIQKGYIVPPQ
ncbi:MAG: response regulator transcription factor [Desulfobulbaceae bacterium]|nr:response regulator transcription factor [Desulfobulbaceae bacterium]